MEHDLLEYIRRNEESVLASVTRCIGFVIWYRFGQEFQEVIKWNQWNRNLQLPLWTHPYMCDFHAKAVSVIRNLAPELYHQSLVKVIKESSNEVTRYRLEKIGFSTHILDMLQSHKYEGRSFLELRKEEIHTYHFSYYEEE